MEGVQIVCSFWAVERDVIGIEVQLMVYVFIGVSKRFRRALILPSVVAMWCLSQLICIRSELLVPENVM
jgi:hypothetical protein